MRTGELIIYTKNGPKYKDGDILCAFNNNKIRSVHTESICSVKDADRNNGLLLPTSLPFHYLNNVSEFRFDRIGNTLQRTRLSDSSTEIFESDKVDVQLFINRRLNHPTNKIFGATGSEFWFGGVRTETTLGLDSVWTKITELTGRLESEEEFQMWPMQEQELKSFLAIRVSDFTDSEAQSFVQPRLSGQDEIEKRDIMIDWKSLLGDIQVTEGNVLDLTFLVGKTINTNKGLKHRTKDQTTQTDFSQFIQKSTGLSVIL